ncbi:MAG: hypothetical protein Q4Q04_06700, partial [Methanocorpusculum sp.]|nr:hypothetical protein [Methanocorpusculum sp.]
KLTVIGKLETVNNLSVENAPVELYAEGIGLLSNGTTNKYGVWSASAELADGEYQIYAEFAGKPFPLDESRSEAVTVTISSPVLYYLILAAVGGVLIFCIVRIVRRRRGRIPDEQREFIVRNEELPASPVQALSRAIRKIFESPASTEDADKLRVLYRETAAVIAGHENIERVLTKTPREITAEVKYLTDEIKSFMSQYEYLHYADVSVSDSDMNMMRSLAGKIVEGYNENNE